MPYKDIWKQRMAQCDWARKNRASIRKYIRKLRLRAIAKLGGKCIYCGCDNPNALEMNHINGGGCQESKVHGRKTKSLYLDIVAGRRNDIELTCRVCNAVHYLVKLKGLPNKWKVIYE
jgi:hypothetical protein